MSTTPTRTQRRRRTDDGWDGEDRRRGSIFERHAQTGLSVIVTMLVAWMGSSLIDLGKEQAKANVQLTQVVKDVSSLQVQTQMSNNDRYTATDARRDLATIRDQLAKLEERFERREREVRK